MRVDAPYVHGVRQFIEGTIKEIQRVAVAQIGRETPVHVEVIDVLRHPQQPEELDGAGGPSGDRDGQLFEQRHGALAPPIANGVCDLAPRDQDSIPRCPPGVATSAGSPASCTGV
jgi:hypothetical protein